MSFSPALIILLALRVNGDRYEGEWRNGRMHGKGVKVMANGDVYNGTWENDKAEGNGVKVTDPPPPPPDVVAVAALCFKWGTAAVSATLGWFCEWKYLYVLVFVPSTSNVHILLAPVNCTRFGGGVPHTFLTYQPRCHTARTPLHTAVGASSFSP